METFQLDIKILHSIFQEKNISEQVIKELVDWIKDLDPSFGLLKSILNQYFEGDMWDTLVGVAQKIQWILVQLQDRKCPKAFIRALLAVIKTNIDKIGKNVSVEMVASKWQSINPEILEYYLQAFDISVDSPDNKQNNSVVKIPLQEYESRIKTLIEKKDYEGAITLIRLIKYPEEYVKLLLTKMANNKDASKAANIIKSHKIDKNLVPKVGERLNKNMVRYFHKNNGWEATEEIFFDNPEAIATMTEDLIFKKSDREAISLWWRHPEIMKFVVKKQSVEFIESMKKKSKEEIEAEVLQNSYFKDYFGPSDNQKYLSFKELGLQRQQVIWIGNEPELIDQLIEEMSKADIMGIDTQSVVGKNKLQVKKMEEASTVQIAFRTKVFVLDGQKCKSKKLASALLQYINSERPVLGHAISNDFDAMLLSLGVKQEEIGYIKLKNIIDTHVLFKAIYPKERYSNLAHICKTVLKKQICKHQTLSNWGRRPIRENQLHYAAMDAFCLIKIYETWKEEVGENVLNYFLEQGI